MSTTLYERLLASNAQGTGVATAILLDGEVGGGLRKMVESSGNGDRKLLPASILVEEPTLVRDLHLNHIHAGAQIITTNTYATVRTRLEAILGLGDRWEEMVTTACEMAHDARKASGKDVLIAGALPPLHGSYRPDQVGAAEEIFLVYREHVSLMAEYVDFFLCETMSTADEGRAAASAARESGKPVWVSWNLKDDGSSLLRSGETLQQAWDAVVDLHPDAVLVNCCMPETVTAAMPALVAMGAPLCGGYANGFTCIPEGWTLQGNGLAALGKRRDLIPETYADMAEQWVKLGAKVVGGCCEVGPPYIAALKSRLQQTDCSEHAEWLTMNKASVSSQVSSDWRHANDLSVSSAHATTNLNSVSTCASAPTSSDRLSLKDLFASKTSEPGCARGCQLG